MASIATTYLPSQDQVKFVITINSGDTTTWAVYIGAKHDHGQGTQSGEYPYFVKKLTGTGSITYYQPRNSLFFADDYSAELALSGEGVVDFDVFTIPSLTGTCDVYVYDYDTQQLLPGASVTINSITKTTNSSGVAGRWTLNAVTGGTTYPIVIAKSGYNTTNGNVVIQPGVLLPAAYYIKKSITTPKHKECQNNVCTQVDGAGTDTCSTIGASCGTVAKHKECQNNVCTEVTGAGTDTCSTIGASCGTIGKHNVCQSGVCTQVDGTGTDECTTVDASCTTNNTGSNYIMIVVIVAIGILGYFMFIRRKK